jgi:hypothetical protein
MTFRVNEVVTDVVDIIPITYIEYVPTLELKEVLIVNDPLLESKITKLGIEELVTEVNEKA